MIYYDWYMQALGGILGLIACVYSYVRGNLILYSNISSHFSLTSFNVIVASYLLYPLCFLTFLIAIINCTKKDKFENLIKFNNYIIYLTSIIGLIGCTFVFIIPSLFILFYKIKSITLKKIHNITNNNLPKKEDTIHTTSDKSTLLNTKIQMATDLLNKNADMNFIMDVTQLSLEEINSLIITNKSDNT